MKAVSLVMAVVVMVVVVTGPLGGGGGVVEAVSCQPDCTGKNLGDKVINPKNCTEYYICLGDGTATERPVSCDPGEIFLEGDTDCSEDDGSGCESPCLGSSGCHLTCNGTGDFIADISDCSVYYICTPSGVGDPHKCSDDHPYFDGKDCVNDKSVCCKSVCAPYCDANNDYFLIPDPLDCRSFYICSGEEVGIPDEDKQHFTCSSGQNFDVQVGECSSTAACTVLCREETTTTTTVGINPNSTTTSTGINPGSTTTSTGINPGSTTTSTGINPDSTTTTLAPTSDCVNTLICTSTGFFPVCHSCQPQYFSCEKVGEEASIGYCSGGLVFNPVPEYPMCVLESNCPYNPNKQT